MAIRSGFFNSINGDRKYDSGFFADYFASFIGNGVFPNPSTNLQVMANDNMTITVKAGTAWINGYILFNDNDHVLNVSVADGVLNRIDRIVLRFDTVGRDIQLIVKQGEFATVPVAPVLQRDADGYELAIADVFIGGGNISITQANITDTRLDNNLCGVVTGLVEQVDTTTLFNQYTQGFEITKTQFEQDFNSWFDSIQNLLDENTAGNLLNLINNLEINKADVVYVDNKLKELKFSELSATATNKDTEDIYKNTTWKRKDNTVYAKSSLIGTSPLYNQIKVDYYNDLGTSIIKTITWNLFYDSNDFIYKKEVV